jgi:hypothetical protein
MQSYKSAMPNCTLSTLQISKAAPGYGRRAASRLYPYFTHKNGALKGRRDNGIGSFRANCLRFVMITGRFL